MAIQGHQIPRASQKPKRKQKGIFLSYVKCHILQNLRQLAASPEGGQTLTLPLN